MTPSYESYTLDELYNVRETMDQIAYPENYDALLEMIKKREAEGPYEPSEDEIKDQQDVQKYNRKIKKGLFYGILSVVGLIIVGVAYNIISYMMLNPIFAATKYIGANSEKLKPHLGENIVLMDDLIDDQELEHGQFKYGIAGSIGSGKLVLTINTENTDSIIFTSMFVQVNDSKEKIELIKPKKPSGPGQWGGRGRR
jgi:hypothetical protein